MGKNEGPKRQPGAESRALPEDQAWLDTAPVGREFGSPDYERLTVLDQAAYAAFQSWGEVRRWLSAPHPQLDGCCPEVAANSPDGLSKVLAILMVAGGHASDDFMGAGEALVVQERDSLKGIKELKGLFGRPSRVISIEDMNAAIASRGAAKK